MLLEFLRPFMLLLLPVGIAAAVLTARRHPRRRALRHRGALILRCALICLCVLALAGPSAMLPGGNGAVWILADASDSAGAIQEEITAAVRTAIRNKDGHLDAGVIAFGGDAMVEAPLSAAPDYQGVRTAVDRQATDLAGALTLAGVLLPSEAGGRIAVLSDGLTDGVSAAAQSLAARGVAVDVMPFAPAAVPDAQVTQVRLPASAYEGQRFSVTVQADALMDTQGTLVLYQDRTPVAAREVTLRRGENTFVFRDVAQRAGVVTYEARLLAEGDRRAQNDSMSAYIRVTGVPRVLVAEGRPGEGSEMTAMLEAAGMACETLLPAQLPYEAEGYLAYDAAVLVNVDYDGADEVQWQALTAAVRTLGRGLCVIGGDSSYALGGYRGSLLEEMLPVTIDVRGKLDMPSLALMLVIDKSGSMTEGMFGTSRLELAKEAAMRACEVLTENDQVGVIAFDDAAKWVVNLQQVADTAAIQRMIGTIRPGGGTAFYTALYEAAHALMESQTAQKHIIFLTDGEAGDSGYESLADTMRENGVTLTTVAVGSGADRQLLRALAARGGGRAYAADEFDNLPKIFTKETYLVSGSYVQNRVFTPVVTHESALTDFDAFPQLTGYLAATEKSLATVELASDRGDPLLAWWQYGAGRALCFMADSRGAWTERFLNWSEAAAFYGGMAAFVLPREQRAGELVSERADGSLKLTYTAPPEGTGLDTRVTALLPDGTQMDAPLTETARGVYSGAIPAAQQGAYALRVEQRRDGALERVLESGAVTGYSQEYDLRALQSKGTLEALAAATGGRVVTDAAELLRVPGARAAHRADLTQGLLWALPALLVLDIAMRRLGWDALERWQRKRAPAREEKKKPKPEAPGKSHPAPEKPAPAADTARELLERRRNRKIL